MSIARKTFLPYQAESDALELHLTSVHLDGESVDVDADETKRSVDLTGLGDWAQARLEFTVSVLRGASRALELIPPREKSKPPLALIASLKSAHTFRRWPAKGAFDADKETGHLVVELERSNTVDAVDMTTYLVRTSHQQQDPMLASEPGSRIMSARSWTFRVDPPTRQPGGGLEIKWQDFASSKIEFLASRPRLLFHLDTTGEAPRLLLNSGLDPDLQSVMSEEAPRGHKATIRNLIFGSIAVPVWMSLVREAERTATRTESGSLEPGWQKDALTIFATEAHPDLSEDAALEQLLRDLGDDAGGHDLHERLPGIAAGMVDFSQRAIDLLGLLQ